MSLIAAVLRAAQQCPSRVAVRDAAGSLSWSGLERKLACLAGALSRKGLSPGDRIAFLDHNSAAHFNVTFAAIWAGLIVVPINARLSRAEMAQIITDSGATALFHGEGFAEDAAFLGATTGLVHVEQLAESHGTTDAQSADQASPVIPTLSDPLGIYYTGGTTGAPKGVVLSHAAVHLTALDQAEGMGVGDGAVYLHVSPNFHLAGVSVANAVTLRRGTHVFATDIGPRGILAAIEQFDISLLSLVPTVYQSVLDELGPDAVVSGVRNIIYGAAPISKPLLERMLHAFPGAELRQAYGQSEIGGACVILPPDEHYGGNPRLVAAGQATSSVHIRIVDDTGAVVPAGTAGEIAIAGLRQMSGYWNRPTETALALRDGWLMTGDIGTMDEEGFITVIDRKKDMIVTGGENVFCAEVENAISNHVDVKDTAVIGVPDDKWGETVHAFVVPKAGRAIAKSDVYDHVRAQIAAYKCPKDVTFMTGLPVSGVGKVRKDLLRQAWAENRKEHG